MDSDKREHKRRDEENMQRVEACQRPATHRLACEHQLGELVPDQGSSLRLLGEHEHGPVGGVVPA